MTGGPHNVAIDKSMAFVNLLACRIYTWRQEDCCAARWECPLGTWHCTLMSHY